MQRVITGLRGDQSLAFPTLDKLFRILQDDRRGKAPLRLLILISLSGLICKISPTEGYLEVFVIWLPRRRLGSGAPRRPVLSIPMVAFDFEDSAATANGVPCRDFVLDRYAPSSVSRGHFRSSRRMRTRHSSTFLNFKIQ